MMRYISLFSGIESASVAWAPLKWAPVAFSEIDPFACMVLKHRFPDVQNLGDITKVDWKRYRGKADLVCGGSPCQSFSIAGLRRSLDDARGNLTLAFVRAVLAVRPRWVVWENVPGVLSTKDNAFGCFLAGLAGADAPLRPGLGGWESAGVVSGPRYGLAWRVLDAQYVGGCALHGRTAVPQRRNRVWVVGHLGDWRPAAKVLFEPESLRWHPAKGGKAGEEIAGCLGGGSEARGYRNDLDSSGAFIAHAVCGHQVKGGDPTTDNYVTHSLRGEGADESEDVTGRGTPLVYDMRGNGDGKTSPTLGRSAAGDRSSDYAPCLLTMRDGKEGGGKGPLIAKDKSLSLATGNNQILFDPNQIASRANRSNPKPGDPNHPLPAQPNAPIILDAYNNKTHEKATSLGQKCGVSTGRSIAFTQNQSGDVLTGDTMPAMGTNQNATGRNTPKVQAGMTVRRLLPVECERLMGLPDGWTDVPYRGKPAADGLRYRAIGNSWATPCAYWIGDRIGMVEHEHESA